MTHTRINPWANRWARHFLLIGLALSVSACATYRPSEAECFNSFAEVTRSNCSFEMLNGIGPTGSTASIDG
ncbi:hypothetical protein [Paracoccus sediminicola]|uniref:hypothetical protein n=1 Tax=Paracoccus sediminicola TaxID=3017783 RepID=UPI0022F10317|nr:hypothetical protein [Paracoccus sediminicola]WBU56589.1 hypothetical protein PAF18_14110 [Paracoccus sediminicola]